MVSTLLEREELGGSVFEPARLSLEDDAHGWTLVAPQAHDGARLRHAFRDYLERYGHPASDFDAAEAVYGELVNNCVRHAPGEIRIEFRWHDATLIVVDTCDRLRSWPFSPDDTSAESTHHAYALISAFTDRIHVTRDAGGGTRASVELPVMRTE
jgi:anti-sigma regulatory factor (Ser/Thr protein kinase)